MNLQEYLSEVTGIYKTGAATEHSYRAALQKLFSSISDDVEALNEPKRVQCGAPDFLINRREIVIGHVEAKDIDKDLSTLKGKLPDQDLYEQGVPNWITGLFERTFAFALAFANVEGTYVLLIAWMTAKLAL